MSPKKFHAVHAAGFLGISSVSRWRYISLQEPNQAVNEHVTMAHIDWGNSMKVDTIRTQEIRKDYFVDKFEYPPIIISESEKHENNNQQDN